MKHVFLRGSMKNIFHISLYVFLFNIIIDYYEFKYLVNGLFILCYSMFLMFMSACYNELETVDFEEQEEQQSVSIEDGMCIIQSLGFDTLDVVELKSGYLIQGDIYLEKVNLSLIVNHKQGRLIILPV